MNSFEACSTFHVTGSEFGIVESSLAELILGALVRFVRIEMFLGLNLCELLGQLGAIRSPKRVVSMAHRKCQSKHTVDRLIRSQRDFTT